MRFRSILLAAFALVALPQALHAQFYTDGTEPGSVKWMKIRTEDYQIIYPRGLDSLARVYAVSLEQVKGPVSGTIGVEPNERFKRRMPVVLHPYSCYSNGMVVWTPHRMELITTPDASAPLPQPWVEQLTVHESRHVAQLQYVGAKRYLPLRVLSGELYAGLLTGAYCGPHFFEGDAVATETALSADGRGRSADFLEYWRASFAYGETRNFWQWRYGLQNRFNPDYYTTGYVTMAGMASLYGTPDFTAKYYENLFGKGLLHFFNFNKTVKQVSGKPFREAFREISDSLARRWNIDADSRMPFTEMTQVTEESRLYTSYESNSVLGDRIYSIRKGIADPTDLYVTDSTGTKRLCAFSGQGLKPDEANGRLWWSETRRDPRWEQRSWSEIRYMGEDGKKHTLRRETRWWNPAPSPDGSVVSVTELPVEGGSAAVVVSVEDGSVKAEFRAPDDLQVVETVWVGDELFASAISLDGLGIYRVSDWTPVFGPTHASVKQLFCSEGTILFVSDLTGVNELYSLDGWQLASRLTSTPLGASEFQVYKDSLVFSAPNLSGRNVWAAALCDLEAPTVADFFQGRTNWLSDSLSAAAPVIDRKKDVDVSNPSPYRRLTHAVNVHSWLPLYYDFDEISDISFESLYDQSGVGATVFFQNLLGTLEGSLAYQLGKSSEKWENALHLNLKYRGLYPVIEFKGMVSTAAPKRYYVAHTLTTTGKYHLGITAKELGFPYASGDLRVYVPLSYTSGGWQKGLIPQVRISLSDNYFTYKKNWPLSRVSASLRGYVMRPTAESAMYPRWGVGFDAGYSGRIGISEVYSPDVYAYIYGYVPGILNTHGIRLTTTLQRQLGRAVFSENYTTVTPRGFSGIGAYVAQFPNQAKITAQYGLPFAPVGWSFLGPVAYIRNFEATAFADASLLGGNGSSVLATVGGSVSARLGNFMWIPYDTRIGVELGYNGGPSYESLLRKYPDVSHFYCSFLFGIDF